MIFRTGRAYGHTGMAVRKSGKAVNGMPEDMVKALSRL